MASMRQMSGQVSRGSAGEYQADERAGVARLSWRVSGRCAPALCNPMDVAYQAPLSMAFFREEYWSGLPFPSPGDLPNPRVEPGLPHCRRILYQLSHQGSPSIIIKFHKNILLGESAALRQSSPLFQGMLGVSAFQIF